MAVYPHTGLSAGAIDNHSPMAAATGYPYPDSRTITPWRLSFLLPLQSSGAFFFAAFMKAQTRPHRPQTPILARFRAPPSSPDQAPD